MGNFNHNYVLDKIIRRVSSGSAFTIESDFYPDKILVHNYTKYGTAEALVESVYINGMPDASVLNKTVIVDSGSTGDQNLNLLTTNGITVTEVPGGVPTTRAVISGISQADPAVVTTSAAHGYSTGDRVRISNVVGMDEINEVSRNPYEIVVLTTTTFSLKDLEGNDIDSTGFGAYVSGGSVNLISSPDRLRVSYAPTHYDITFGSNVAGADNDVLFIELLKAGEYVDQGKP